MRCLFFVGAILAGHPATAGQLPASDCLSAAESRTARIVQITDGDSLLLDDGHRLRLIGINALELHSTDEQERLLARQARDALQDLLHEQSVRIFPGLQTHDAYDRILAHVRLADGRDAAHTLVSEGLALAVAIGINTRCADSLMAMERHARERRSGLWRSPGNWHIGEELSGREQGFHVVSARVIDISGHGARTTLHLSNGLHVMLGQHWSEHSNTYTLVPEKLAGSKVQVRGWLNSINGQPEMTLHHPDNIELISNQ